MYASITCCDLCHLSHVVYLFVCFAVGKLYDSYFSVGRCIWLVHVRQCCKVVRIFSFFHSFFPFLFLELCNGSFPLHKVFFLPMQCTYLCRYIRRVPKSSGSNLKGYARLNTLLFFAYEIEVSVLCTCTECVILLIPMYIVSCSI